MWVKGLKLDEKINAIISWNNNKISFNYLKGKKSGQLIYQLKDLVPTQNYITDVIINIEFRYFMSGTSSGDIIVWKFDDSKTQIHTFEGHFKAITCLMQVKDEPQLFISSSIDSTIRIWSLDKFKQLYILNLQPTDELTCVKFLNDGKKIVTAFGNHVKISAIHFILKNFLAVDTQIDEMICGFRNQYDL